MSSSAHGKHRKRRRGCHKRAGSPETRLWERAELIPQRPPWMPEATYVALAKLRNVDDHRGTSR